MEWKFPGGEEKRATRDWQFPSYTNEEDTVKRATRDWTFPSMAEEAEENDGSFGVDLSMPEIPASAGGPRRSLGRSNTDPTSITSYDEQEQRFGDFRDFADHPDRPDTALSHVSVDTDIDYDPFRLEAFEDQESTQLRQGLQRMLKGQGAETSTWPGGHDQESSGSAYSEDSQDDMQRFLTARGPDSASTATPPTGYSYSPGNSTLVDQSYRNSRAIHMKHPPSSSTDSRSSSSVPSSRRGGLPTKFPNVIPPSAEVMTEGAGEDAMYEELDRLVGAWTSGLAIVASGLRYLGEDEDGESDDYDDVEVEEGERI